MSSKSPRNCQYPKKQTSPEAFSLTDTQPNSSLNSPSSAYDGNLTSSDLKLLSRPLFPLGSPRPKTAWLSLKLILMIIVSSVGLVGIASAAFATPCRDGCREQLSETPANYIHPPLLLAQTPSAAPNSVNVIYVSSSTGNDSGEGTQASPLRSITQALRVAPPNTAILLAPGTYSVETGEAFPLILKPNITIQGNTENKGQDVVIYGGGVFSSRVFANQNVAIVGANAARLSGVTVTNPHPRGYGLWIESSSMVVSNNTFTGNIHDGISVVGTSAPLVQQNSFANNGANGITVYGSSKPEIRDNDFENTGFGINIAQQSEPFVVGNRIAYNRDGIVIQSSARPVLRNNYIEQNERDGIVVIAQSLPDLGTPTEPGENVIRNNGRYDVNNGTKGLTILAYGNELAMTKNAGSVELAGSYQSGAGPSAIANRIMGSSTEEGGQNHSSSISPINQAASLPIYLPESNVTPLSNTAPPPIPVDDSEAIVIPVPPPERPQQVISAPVAAGSPPPPVRLQTAAENPSTGSLLLSLVRRAVTSASNPEENSQTVYIPVPPPQRQSTITSPPPPASSDILRVPGGNIPIGTGGGQLPSQVTAGLAPATTAGILGLRYRVVVNDTSSQILQRVRSLVPQAFTTVINGRSLIQAGAFRSQHEANRLLQQLRQRGVTATIEPFN
ncbi:DUF1565 domain-containing protein [Limnospira fusiformis KN01]|uniref:SPOR domain-containing protein n=2 Tax=Limnospira TaxID=2596745 RepID=B5VVY9_LIMMA|nr:MULTISPECIES: DUF1565 domain-containing protein [Limnospira]EDZ96757.1 protein of unknown function DUF1565 [Limnospira maxima CS-328]MDT9187925.1 DUF1565 domain-containing protein [Limnospira sp. PMC 894.15]MDT9197164.1 DUF1565 domain-containing protein [Limnospira sp. PMC 1042.18]MDT9233794.1 DUF1565 domain-containing protein [Limnospira sp. PMC 917.15]MDT9275284.1 DUF1565 domain-containing protein [Limnospira sp. PMC 737.11]